MNQQIKQVAKLIQDSKRIVVFVGAGMSTESGIPDFRTPGGIWDRYDPEDFYFQRFLSSESSREKYWQMSSELYRSMRDAQPNQAHLAIAELEARGKLDCLITQNIDGLHFKAGNSASKVIELHGTVMYVTCLSCGERYESDEIQRRILSGVAVPRCDRCDGLLKPATVSFGQQMPEQETQMAYDHSASCDLFIVVGSSLAVQPAASMPVVAKRHGAQLVIINRDDTLCDNLADIIINDQAGRTMAAVMTELKRA